MTPKYRILILAVLAVLFALLLFREAIIEIFTIVVNRQGSSHGVFVPFLALYFLYLKLDRLKKIECQLDPIGVVLIFAGVAFPVFHVGTFHIHFIAYIFVLAGLVLLLFGREMFKQTAFPIFFLITTVPIPRDTYVAIANYSRRIAFGGSLKIISLFGIPHFRDGWDIQLPNALLNVAISCSGIRYMISYFVFGIAYAYIMKSTSKARITTVALTIPISHIASILRLTVIFMMTYYVSPYWSQPKPHIWLSWFVFFSILFGMMALDQYFSKRLDSKKIRAEVKNPI